MKRLYAGVKQLFAHPPHQGGEVSGVGGVAAVHSEVIFPKLFKLIDNDFHLRYPDAYHQTQALPLMAKNTQPVFSGGNASFTTPNLLFANHVQKFVQEHTLATVTLDTNRMDTARVVLSDFNVAAIDKAYNAVFAVAETKTGFAEREKKRREEGKDKVQGRGF